MAQGDRKYQTEPRGRVSRSSLSHRVIWGGIRARLTKDSVVVQLSIVIPMSQCMEAFEATLASVLRNRPEHSEILVVSSGDYDDPYALSDEVSFLATPPGTGLLTLINTGLRYAQGEIIHLLLCGAEVEEGWTESALQHF